MAETTKRYSDFETLFNSAKYYEAHELLEDEWRLEMASRKIFLQGLILLCGACVHAQKKNEREASRMARLATERLESNDFIQAELENANGILSFLNELERAPLDALERVPKIQMK